MPLILDQWHHVRTGEPFRGFSIRNRRGKLLAIGCGPAANGSRADCFVVMHAPRYEHDLDLCRAIRRLTGSTPRNVRLEN